MVGCSISMLGKGVGSAGSVIVSPIFAWLTPVMATMSPATTRSTSWRFRPLYVKSLSILPPATVPSGLIRLIGAPALATPRSIRPRAYLPRKLSYCKEVISMRKGLAGSTCGAGICSMIARKIGVRSADVVVLSGVSVQALPSRPMA